VQVADLEASEAIRRVLAEPTSGNVPALGVEGLVSSGEIDNTIASAQNAFNELDTVRSRLTNGRSVEATNLFVPFSIDAEPHFVRLMRYIDAKGRLEPDVFVVFDATESAERVLVRDPSMIKLESGNDGPKGIYVAQGIGNPDELNGRADVTFVEQVIHSLYTQHDLIETEKVNASRVAIEREMAIKSEQRRVAAVRRRGAIRTVDRIAKKVAAVTLVAAIGVGAIKGVSSMDFRDAREKFDDKTLVIEGGKIIGVGQEGAPEFSFKLLNDTQLEKTDIPEVGDLRESPHDDSRDSSTDEDSEALTNESNKISPNKLRELVITSTSSGKASEQTHVQLTSPDDVIKVWTDSQKPENIRVSLGQDGLVTVKRLDPETSDSDDVRVVIEHIPAVQQK